MAKDKQPNPIKALALSFDSATFDALVAEKEVQVRNKIALEGPSKRFLRLRRTYDIDSAYTVLAAEKVMAKIIKKREQLAGRSIPYESWPTERARLDVTGKYMHLRKKQTVVTSARTARPPHARWTHGFTGTGRR